MLCSENYTIVEHFPVSRNGDDQESAAVCTQMHEEQAGPSLTSLLVEDLFCTKCSQRLPPVPSRYGGEILGSDALSLTEYRLLQGCCPNPKLENCFIWTCIGATF